MTLKEAAEKHLATWPLYNSGNHEVSTRTLNNGGEWLGYRTASVNQITKYTHFDVNRIEKIFFILSIYLEQKHRGKGHGDALYKVLEAIAEEIGCSKVQMMPSGWTSTGETRRDYLLRRGYRVFGTEVVKDVSLKASSKSSALKGE